MTAASTGELSHDVLAGDLYAGREPLQHSDERGPM
jgi:hypothetical protein